MREIIILSKQFKADEMADNISKYPWVATFHYCLDDLSEATLTSLVRRHIDLDKDETKESK